MTTVTVCGDRCLVCGFDKTRFGCGPVHETLALGKQLLERDVYRCGCPLQLRKPSAEEFAEALADLVKWVSKIGAEEEKTP